MGTVSNQVELFIKNANMLGNNIVSQIIEDVVASVVTLSPVDTGNFISNWELGVDTHPKALNDNKNPDKEASISRIISQIPIDAMGHTYYIDNNSDYGIKLETGQGMITPAYAMVKSTGLRFPGIVRRVLSANKVNAGVIRRVTS